LCVVGAPRNEPFFSHTLGDDTRTHNHHHHHTILFGHHLSLHHPQVLEIITIPSVATAVLCAYAACGGLLICCLETQLKFLRVMIAVNFGFLFQSAWRFLFYLLLASVAWSLGFWGRICGVSGSLVWWWRRRSRCPVCGVV
jgi:hypothetical protein